MNSFVTCRYEPASAPVESRCGYEDALRDMTPADLHRPSSSSGCVWIVGAGPGDAELLTLKAWKVIQQADIIFFDNLVSHSIRALFPAHTPAHYVGKEKHCHSMTQAQINQLLVAHAQQGLRVCRVKGGDPFVFGRGSEELVALRQMGIHAEVIPGITAASGCTTASDIPLTHRGVSQGCTFVTGHAEKSLDIAWSALASLKHTLVFYMGLSACGMIKTQLIHAGLSQDTPCALIENGCRDNQKTYVTTLAALDSTARQHAVTSPALIVIGDVVLLREQLTPTFITQALAQQWA